MIFLNPALLFGLLAASIPILIHLLNLRKLKKIEFSTLAFLKELQKNKIRKVKLKQWILLVLRVLIIMFLVLSFSRPALESVSLGISSKAKTTAVILIDNTFSMSIIDDDGSFLNQAKEKAKEILSQFQEGDEIIIITSSTGDADIFRSSNFELLTNYINRIEVTYRSIDLNDILHKADELLRTSTNFNKEIFLLTDFQQSRFSEDHAVQSISDNTKIYFVQYSTENTNNLAITNLSVGNQIFEVNKNITFTATISNFSDNRSESNVASLFVNGVRSAQNSFDVEANGSVQIDFQTSIPGSGLLNVFVELEDDAIVFDNKRYISIRVPDKLKIIMLADNASDMMFVKAALTSTKNNQFAISSDLSERINAYDLNDFDIVMLFGSDYKNGLQKINNYLDNNGSLIIFPGSNSNAGDFTNFVAQVGLPAPEAVINTSPGDSYLTFDKINFDHPVFSNVFEKDKQFSSPQVFSYYKLFTKGKGKNIINLTDGSAFLSEYDVQKGKIILFNSAPVLSSTDFPLKGIFAPILNNLVYYLSSANSISPEYTTGDQVAIDSGNKSILQLKVIKPNSSSEILNLDFAADNRSIIFNGTDDIGTYEFYTADRLIGYASVNFNILESDLKTLSKDEVENKLKAAFPSASILGIDKENNIAEALSQARFGTELWKFFLILALLTAMIEMWVSKSSKKDLVEISKGN